MHHHDIHLIEIGEKAGAEKEREAVLKYLKMVMEETSKSHSQYWVARQLIKDVIEGKHRR